MNTIKMLVAVLTMTVLCTVVKAQSKVKAQYTVYAEIKINGDSIIVQILQKDTVKYWKIINLKCEKIVVGTETTDFSEKNETGLGRISGSRIVKGDTLDKGKSKIYPLDFFSQSRLYNKKYPNFVLAWNLNDSHPQKLGDYFVHFYDDHAPLGVQGKIGDWF